MPDDLLGFPLPIVRCFPQSAKHVRGESESSWRRKVVPCRLSALRLKRE